MCTTTRTVCTPCLVAVFKVKVKLLDNLVFMRLSMVCSLSRSMAISSKGALAITKAWRPMAVSPLLSVASTHTLELESPEVLTIRTSATPLDTECNLHLRHIAANIESSWQCSRNYAYHCHFPLSFPHYTIALSYSCHLVDSSYPLFIMLSRGTPSDRE